MKKFFWAIICQLFITPCLFAQWPAINGTLKWHGTSVDESFQNAKVLGTALIFTLPDLNISPGISLVVEAGANLEIGSSNATYIKEFAPEREVLLSKAYLEFLPSDWLKLSAGAINQDEYQSPLLLGARAFVAASQQVSISLGQLNQLFIRSQQSIPSNDTLTNRIGSIDGKSPQFFMHTLGLDLEGDIVSLEVEVSLWRFQGLPNSVAYYSRLMGNTVSGVGTDGSRFFYKYFGKNARFNLTLFEQSSVNFSLNGQWVINDDAADGHDQGQMVSAGPSFFGHQLFFHWMRNESDSSVAFYNSSFLGHNNRKGYGVSLAGKLNGPWSYSVRAWDLSLIENSLYQSEGRRFQFGLERNF
ncbi:MAG: hypothetical protein OHK0056_26540 [Bacteriovoracaceae bacterium]